MAEEVELQLSTNDAKDLNRAIKSINSSEPIQEVDIIEGTINQDIKKGTIDKLSEKYKGIEQAVNIISSQHEVVEPQVKPQVLEPEVEGNNYFNTTPLKPTDYDETAWLKFLDAYASAKGLVKEDLIKEFDILTPVQKKELYAYYKRDPSIIENLDLKLENIDNLTKLSKYHSKTPVIFLTDNPELGFGNYLVMLSDGGVVTTEGKEAVWDNKSRNADEFKLGFREANMLDTNRLLQNDIEGLKRAMMNPKAVYNKFNPEGGKSKKLKRKSKNKTKSKRKSKTKSKRKSKGKSKRSK